MSDDPKKVSPEVEKIMADPKFSLMKELIGVVLDEREKAKESVKEKSFLDELFGK